MGRIDDDKVDKKRHFFKIQSDSHGVDRQTQFIRVPKEYKGGRIPYELSCVFRQVNYRGAKLDER